jgi:serine/threonine-protein kinase PRP4
MTTSRASSASEGERVDPYKANRANQRNESEINGASRVFGLDGAADNYGRKYRALSRSPSPYRRKTTRSPSPYRSRRAPDRSPSPYRHIARSDRGQDDSRSYSKRKTSPPRGGRPEKRHHADRGRGDREGDYRANEMRRGYDERKDVTERSYSKPPVSYAELEHTPAVPDFRDGLPTNGRSQNLNNGSQQRDRTRHATSREHISGTSGSRAQAARPMERQDVEMYVASAPGPPTSTKNSGRKSATDETEYMPAPEPEKVPTEESREEKRRRWAAKRAAAEQKMSQDLLHKAVLTNASEVSTPNMASPAQYAESSVSPSASPRYGDLESVPASPDVMVIDKQGVVSEGNSPAADDISAADFDPMQDMLDERDRAAKNNGNTEMSSADYQETDSRALSTLPAQKMLAVKKQKKELDMFASDDEDEDLETVVDEAANTKGTVLDEKMLDNWDDKDGYYKLISNELVNSKRYRMVRDMGRGVYANVALAEDTSPVAEDASRQLVAIKMIRSNEMLMKTSLKELEFVRKLNEADPQDKKHVIRLLGSFDHKGHLCIVFECMSKNLRDLLKEDASGHGLTLPMVRMYAKQMFSALQHLQNCKVLHLDLKPDNVLVSADKKTVKLADFGTAVDTRDIIERTDMLVSRFYRAPEIILGMEISYPVDVWAIGCTIYELWTGKILFTGRHNNHMVKTFMDCLGWPSEKLLRKGLANSILQHFEFIPSLKFISRETDQQGNVRSMSILIGRTDIHRTMFARLHPRRRFIVT